jgi:hypothetical protein
MTKVVISKLDADTNYETRDGDSVRSVLVRGGVGFATRDGVRTEVSDEDAEFLAKHGQFIEHEKRGHVRIESIAPDPDHGRPD